jgi:endo-1,4-beta-D-glucanase Y
MKRSKRALLLLVLLVLAACDGGSDERASEQRPAPPHPRTADRRATEAAYAFLDTYTTADGRIQRIDQGGDTVGEGQAYGLLMAAALRDERRFERIWQWTRRHVTRPDGLMVFRWADGRVQDPQPASDADLDAVRALLIGACRFERPELRTAAERIGRALLRRQTAHAPGGPVLLAGPWAVAQGRLTINPSYLDPTTLTALNGAFGDRGYAAVADKGRRTVESVSRPLPPDWAVVDATTGQARPVDGASSAGGDGRFSWDAPRALVRLATDPEIAGRRIAARTWPAFAGRRPEQIPVEHHLDGRPAGTARSAVTLVAAAGAATAAGKVKAAEKLLAAADDLNRQEPSYYGGAWVALGRLMLTTDRLDPPRC